YSTMGTSGVGAQHLNTYEKNQLDWLPDANVARPTTDGTFRIRAHDLSTFDAANAYAIRLFKDNQRDYWIDFRQHSFWSGNAWLMNGVGVRWDNWSFSGGGELLDTTPLTKLGKTDAYLALGRTFTDPIEQINITPTALSAGQWIDVRVTFGKSPSAPSASFTASSSSVATNQTVSFTATAGDADGDELAYQWDFGDDTFGTNSASASKSWSAAGKYRVRLTVSDMKGRTLSTSTIVTVGAPSGSQFTVSGRVVDHDGDPVGGALVNNGLAITSGLYRSAYADSDGLYTLTKVSSGTYSFAAFNAGLAHTAEFINPVVLNANKSGLDFTARPIPYKITGRVLGANHLSVVGALVTDGQVSDTSVFFGNYTLPYVAPGKHLLTATKQGSVYFRDIEIPVAVEFGDAAAIILIEKTFQVEGTITGVTPGQPVTITTGLNSVTKSSTSGTLSYSLPVSPGIWNLYVTAASGATFTPLFANPIVVDAPQAGRDFSLAAPANHSARGRATELNYGVDGAAITLNPGDRSVVTDAIGGFYIDQLAPGDYTLTAVKAGVTFAEPTRAFTISSSSVSGQDFASTHANQTPTFTTPPFANRNPTNKFTTLLGTLAADNQGESGLRYDWSVIASPSGANVSFEIDNSNTAKSTFATLSATGSYLLRVTVFDQLGASSSSDLTVTIDQTAPTVAAIGFSFATGQSAFVRFSENVGASLTLDDFDVLNLNTSQLVPDSAMSVSFSPATNTGTIQFVGNSLANAQYRVTLVPSGVSDLAGNALISGTTFEFFALAGDANRDRHVDSLDQAILTAHLGQSGTFSSGDFSYNGIIDAADQAILDANFHLWLPVPGALALPATGGNDAYRLARESSALIDVFAGADVNPAFRIVTGAITALSFAAGGGSDSLVIDYSSGDPLPASGMSFDGGQGADTFGIIGTPLADSVEFEPLGAFFNGANLFAAAAEQFTFDGKGGWDGLSVGSGAPPVICTASQQLQSLDLSENTTTSLAMGLATPTVLRSLSMGNNAGFDLNDGDLILDYSGSRSTQLDTIQALINSARNFGAWNAPGLKSN
ncbi:MAG: carboxypeptidase regulatory-like domain-containing protein, partial [Tepidisphaeraceae bacterium]